MIRPWMMYGGVLVVGMGLSWVRYTTDDGKAEKQGVPLLEEKKEDLTSILFASPDADAKVELRKDALGTYGWVTVTEHKQKKGKEGEPPPPVETKVTSFKAGSAGDKLIESLAPMMAMRELVGVDETKIEAFGLKDPTTSLAVTAGSKTATLDIGGETYGAKDLYAKHRESSRYYVVDDELIKPLKFAATRLPERNVFSYKVEELDNITLSKGGKSVSWLQHNKEDRAADWWERLPTPGTDAVGKKDETFANWLEKALKLKSQSYVQAGDEPAAPSAAFDLSFSVNGKPTETLHVLALEDDWFANSDFTRGLVKLTKSAVADTADEVEDILEGREPPPDEKKPPAPDAPPGSPMGGPPGMGERPAGMPGMPPGMPRPGMMPPGGPMKKAVPAGGE